MNYKKVTTIAAIIAVTALTACSGKKKMTYTPDIQADIDIPDDIDIDSLNKAADDIKNLNLDTDVNVDFEEPEVPEVPGASDESAQASGDVVKYSYTDVTTVGNDITVVPNGGLNSSTKLFNDKDLDGFLDYVDSTVLEKGRTINRDMFYDILATMLVDRDLSSGNDTIEKNMIMALAMANNFHDTDVKIKECDLDANNAAEYHYQVKAFGTDDTWIVNYGKRTVYFNNGATEYSSDMFKDDYLALWLVAIEEYYGL